MESDLFCIDNVLSACNILCHCFNANFVPLESLSKSCDSWVTSTGAEAIRLDWHNWCSWWSPLTKTVALEKKYFHNRKLSMYLYLAAIICTSRLNSSGK